MVGAGCRSRDRGGPACAALREDVQVDWADDEPGAAARGSGLGDAQAPARHARQAASVEGALLGFDGGHEYEAQ